jgi:hypothetical protein
MYLQLHIQSVPITTKIVSSNPVISEVYSIQHYGIDFVRDLRQVGVYETKSLPVSSTIVTSMNSFHFINCKTSFEKWTDMLCQYHVSIINVDVYYMYSNGRIWVFQETFNK